MTFDPRERVSIGGTGLAVSRLGFGAAPIGGLFSAVTDDQAETVLRHAWQLGIRYFDTAPLYGYGASERRVGRALAGRPRDSFVLSTKVGRLVREPQAIPAGALIDRQALGDREDAFYVGTGRRRVIFDYSPDGVRRSLDESLERLGLDRIDICLIHDPDDHWQQAIGGAYPTLHGLREEGVIGAIGAGMNQSAMLARFAREGEFDVFLLAGRYTLLDQEALGELMPLCLEKGISVVVGGVMNSGILADPSAGSRFDYRPAQAGLVERARRLDSICARHGVPLKAAAVQFALAHPAVVSVVAGVRSVAHLDEYPSLMRQAIPAELWAELKVEGLLAAEAPTPA